MVWAISGALDGEMAIAANLPPPRVFIVESPIVDAVAFGTDEQHSTIVISQGLLTLFFDVRPQGTLLLSGIEAVDAERHRTRFHLYDQKVGQTFDETLFTPPGS